LIGWQDVQLCGDPGQQHHRCQHPRHALLLQAGPVCHLSNNLWKLFGSRLKSDLENILNYSRNGGKIVIKTSVLGLRIRICRIRMFLGVLDPDWIRILQYAARIRIRLRISLSSSENVRKTWILLFFVFL
jgi:hypothetical protein